MNAVTVYRKLDELGETADRVADSLRRKGIKGRKRAAKCCPISNYVKKELDFTSVWTNQHDVLICIEGGDFIKVINNKAIAEFINNLDNDEYPFLIEGAAR